MKTLYIIGGTMGVGKTTVGQYMKRLLNNSVFLDGDWCWDANPHYITEETQNMVKDNICYILNNFVKCSVHENIIFCWIMQRQDIIDDLLSKINTSQCNVKIVSLICDEKTLRERLLKDISMGKRTADVIESSLTHLPMYYQLDTIRINTTGKNIDTVAQEIIAK